MAGRRKSRIQREGQRGHGAQALLCRVRSLRARTSFRLARTPSLAKEDRSGGGGAQKGRGQSGWLTRATRGTPSPRDKLQLPGQTPGLRVDGDWRMRCRASGRSVTLTQLHAKEKFEPTQPTELHGHAGREGLAGLQAHSRRLTQLPAQPGTEAGPSTGPTLSPQHQAKATPEAPEPLPSNTWSAAGRGLWDMLILSTRGWGQPADIHYESCCQTPFTLWRGRSVCLFSRDLWLVNKVI